MKAGVKLTSHFNPASRFHFLELLESEESAALSGTKVRKIMLVEKLRMDLQGSLQSPVGFYGSKLSWFVIGSSDRACLWGIFTANVGRHKHQRQSQREDRYGNNGDEFVFIAVPNSFLSSEWSSDPATEDFLRVQIPAKMFAAAILNSRTLPQAGKPVLRHLSNVVDLTLTRDSIAAHSGGAVRSNSIDLISQELIQSQMMVRRLEPLPS
jgi:hypothetical protein